MFRRLIWILLITLSFFGCSEKKVEKPQTMVIPVTAYQVPQPKDQAVELVYPGKTRSVSFVTVSARITGILQRQYFKEGDFVKKGQVLFLIEPDLYEAAYISAKAGLEKALADYEKAEKDWKRIEASFKARVVSEQERDAAFSAYKTAKANVEYAKAQLRQAEINLGYTKVIAPVSGIAGQRLVDVGNLVNPGTPLVTINQVDPIYVDFSFPDRDLIKLGFELTKKGLAGVKGLKVDLLIEGKAYGYSGIIDFIDTLIDENTASVKARAVFKNPEKVLLPGQFVQVVVRGVKRRNVILIPQKAVFQTPTGPVVWVIRDNKVQPQPVKLGEASNDYVVIEEGLKPGDLIAIDNLLKLKPGISVKVEKVVGE
ncbi:efflux RND transporter periplasmic adaptor subunit [Thermodesulfobacterium sp. TA1]|uniref:efflux RND transporter periplasmic adaptor subunit n=1 Tax=Thermodesulfobacterium sp. TA1 TaxID=2234087 RepID=UPI001232BE33|nr:efflux RND transporter periplasmic adaptor subunit [Thermodesulfobacterium sp. TA1]QER42257.1 efflux RND transporter periplasmic adaptor subunit [Thermodesulfobacterium sp. TA1]